MKRNLMLALAAAALVALATPQLAQAGCMTTPAVEDVFATVRREHKFFAFFNEHLLFFFQES
jgi:hypothetical protein